MSYRSFAVVISFVYTAGLGCQFDQGGVGLIDALGPADASAVNDSGPAIDAPVGVFDAAPGIDASTDCTGGPMTCQGWWDLAYLSRRRLTVTTGPNTPMNGYDGYTVRLTDLDTAAAIAGGTMQDDCDDLRVVHQPDLGNSGSWAEVPRHVIDCDSEATEVRIKLVANIGANSTDQDYYIYTNNPGAGEPPDVTTTNVYLWFDDATTNRLGDYDTGLIDNWLNLSSLYQGTQWDSGDYYKYDTGNSALNSLRRNVAERDVYIEAEFRHELCEQDNMSTGLVVRGIIDSGTGGTERADHYYTGMRGHNASCGEAYSWDANIQKTQSGTRAVNGVRPGTIATGQWRSQALAAWGVNPTNLRYWDANASWSDRGFAGPDDVLTQGTDGGANDYEGAGFAGVWFVQDKADLRNIIIRRYVDPEPTLAPGPAETQVP